MTEENKEAGESLGKAENTPPQEAAEKPKDPGMPLISIDHFAAVELKVGVVVEAGPHPNADRLLVMQVNVGEETPRQIVAGIRSDWEPEELVGRTLIVCCNLKPAKLRGVESQGMMLAVRGEDRVWPINLEGAAAPGTRVT